MDTITILSTKGANNAMILETNFQVIHMQFLSPFEQLHLYIIGNNHEKLYGDSCERSTAIIFFINGIKMTPHIGTY